MGANIAIDGTAQASTEHEVAHYVDCVFEPGDIVEVRCLRKRDGKPDVNQGWHIASSLVTRIGPLTKLNNDGWNVYVGANPRPYKRATTDSCIQIARCLFAD